MRKILFLLLLITSAAGRAGNGDSLNWGAFGKVHIYKPASAPSSLVLFISGDGGWSQGVVGMARILTGMDALVVGIDIQKYYKYLRTQNAACYYPASDFENLSVFIQKKYKFPNYFKPVLAGYSSGATLIYALLVQAPANTFKGGLSLGFCPDIEISKPLCSGAGLKSSVLKPGISYYLEACKAMPVPWISLQGLIDQVCDPRKTSEYMKDISDAKMISLPKVGHGFSVERNWVPQFRQAFTDITSTPPLFGKNRQVPPVIPEISAMFSRIDKLPVTVYPAGAAGQEPMIMMISGDGGWTGWDESLAQEFAKRGYPVAGLDAQKYFWDAKDPVTATTDLQNIINYYQHLWKRDAFIFVGYSFGANIVPFAVNRFEKSFREKLSRAAMLSPDPDADFEIHVADMLDIGSSSDHYDVVAEVMRIKGTELVCIFGESESESDQMPFRVPALKIRSLPGNHHYRDDFPRIAESILK